MMEQRQESTIMATVRSLRKTYGPKRIISAAIAVSPKNRYSRFS